MDFFFVFWEQKHGKIKELKSGNNRESRLYRFPNDISKCENI